MSNSRKSRDSPNLKSQSQESSVHPLTPLRIHPSPDCASESTLQKSPMLPNAAAYIRSKVAGPKVASRPALMWPVPKWQVPRLDLQVRVRVSESEWEKQRVRVSEIFFSLSLSDKIFENTHYLHSVTFLASLHKELPAAMSLMIMSTMNRLCSWRLLGLCTWDQLQWRRKKMAKFWKRNAKLYPHLSLIARIIISNSQRIICSGRKLVLHFWTD